MTQLKLSTYSLEGGEGKAARERRWAPPSLRWPKISVISNITLSPTATKLWDYLFTKINKKSKKGSPIALWPQGSVMLEITLVLPSPP